MNSVIIVAAGTGSRFGGEIPKQFVEICGKPLLAHTLERFELCAAVNEIVLVVSPDTIASLDRFVDVAQFKKVKAVVGGGKTRAESVRNGLAAVDAKCEVIAVHDGARPLVSVDEIERVLAMAAKTDAACLVSQLADTIKIVRGGEISGTVDRNTLRRALTPQAFRIDILKRAFQSADLGEAVTDECYLVEKLGHPIAIVEGSSRNIKITHADDITFAEMILRAEGGKTSFGTSRG